MTTLPADQIHGAHDHAQHHELGFVRKYVFSMDHKVIGIQFLFTSLLFLVLGGLLALGVRWQLAWPFDVAKPMPLFPSAFVSATQSNVLSGDMYNMLFSMHATIMIFFVIIPLLMGAFANSLIPLQIGAKDMAFPMLNMLSYWVSASGGAVILASFYYGGAQAGWTSYPPLSELAGQGQTLWLVALLLVGTSSLMGAVNYLTTILNLRCPGMTMFRMPLMTWTLFINSVLILMSTPVLASALIMLLFDRHFGTSFFNISAAVRSGESASALNSGQPLMWQHLFWFYSHPAVYIMILPAMGITSEVISTFSRKPIFGYKPMVFAVAGIAFLGYIVWGHHMFASGMNPILGTTFMASTILIAVPSAIKTFNWLGTLWGGQIHYTPAFLCGLGFVSMFVIGGLSGIFMACAPVDLYFHDTYFIVGHIHYVLFGGSLFGIFAGIYFWYPKMFGKMLNQRLGVLHFWLTIIAFNLTFFTMHIVGIGGHPRRYATILMYPSLEHLQPLNILMTIGALMLGMAQIIFVINVFFSLGRWGNRILIYPAIIAIPEILGHIFNIPSIEFATMIWHTGGTSVLTPVAIFILLFILFGLIDAVLRGIITAEVNRRFNRGVVALVWIAAVPLCLLPIFGKGDFWEWIGVNSTTYVMSDKDYTGAPMQPYPMAVDMNRMVDASTLKFDNPARASEPVKIPTVTAILINDSKLAQAADDAKIGLSSVAAVEAARKSMDSHRQFAMDLSAIEGLDAKVKPLVQGAEVMVTGYVAEISKFQHEPNHMVSRSWQSPTTGQFRIVVWDNVALGHIIVLLTSLIGLALYLVYGRKDPDFGDIAGSNPWNANSLEWYATSPPWHENFHETPVVYRGPYEYASPVSHYVGREDYLTQWDKLPPGVEEPSGHH